MIWPIHCFIIICESSSPAHERKDEGGIPLVIMATLSVTKSSKCFIAAKNRNWILCLIFLTTSYHQNPFQFFPVDALYSQSETFVATALMVVIVSVLLVVKQLLQVCLQLLVLDWMPYLIALVVATSHVVLQSMEPKAYLCQLIPVHDKVLFFLSLTCSAQPIQQHQAIHPPMPGQLHEPLRPFPTYMWLDSPSLVVLSLYHS